MRFGGPDPWDGQPRWVIALATAAVALSLMFACWGVSAAILALTR